MMIDKIGKVIISGESPRDVLITEFIISGVSLAEAEQEVIRWAIEVLSRQLKWLATMTNNVCAATDEGCHKKNAQRILFFEEEDGQKWAYYRCIYCSCLFGIRIGDPEELHR